MYRELRGCGNWRCSCGLCCAVVVSVVVVRQAGQSVVIEGPPAAKWASCYEWVDGGARTAENLSVHRVSSLPVWASCGCGRLCSVWRECVVVGGGCAVEVRAVAKM